jgi:hypothetical protein
MIAVGGFRFRETLSGTWTRDGVTRPMRFSLTAQVASWLRHLRDHKAALDGTVTLDGLASERPLGGEMTIDPIFARRIRYEFSFTGDDGRRYCFSGQKDITVRDPVGSLTRLPAAIYDEHERQIATAELAFDTRDLPRLLLSFRPTWLR